MEGGVKAKYGRIDSSLLFGNCVYQKIIPRDTLTFEYLTNEFTRIVQFTIEFMYLWRGRPRQL